MKVLFLDFDGVLNSHNGIAKRNYEQKYLDEKYLIFKEHVDALNWLLEQVPDTKIVISSSWRSQLELWEIVDLLKKNGFKSPKSVIGVTPYNGNKGEDRVDEIEDWIENSERHVETFVVVDDKNLKDIDDNFVRISNQYGFCHFDAVLCKQILTKQPAPVVFF